MQAATENEIVIPPVENEHEIPAGARCQEASRLSSNHYIPCSAPASAIVFSPRERRSFYMCDVCASHAIDRRGMELRLAIELPPQPDQQLVTFSVKPITYELTKAEVERVASAALMLRVNDVNDKEGLERCQGCQSD